MAYIVRWKNRSEQRSAFRLVCRVGVDGALGSFAFRVWFSRAFEFSLALLCATREQR